MDYLIVQHNQIKKWKTTILEIVKYGFIKNISADVQDSVGIWKNAGDAMPFIRDNNQSVLVDEGVLSFSIIINEETILYSLWLQAGEIRIGFKVPNNLIQANKTQIEQKLANLYNGKPCERINRDKDAVFFDWIFSDQFASFDTMQKSFIEVQSEVDFKPTTILIANKIYDMLTHIFIASANGIIDANGYTVSTGFVGKTKKVLIELSGNIDSFKNYSLINGIIINSKEEIPTASGLKRYMLKIEMPIGLSINVGFQDESKDWKIERIKET